LPTNPLPFGLFMTHLRHSAANPRSSTVSIF
jgi:hypothetical protein